MKIVGLTLGAFLLASAAPAAAQSMQGMQHMPGMTMPMPKKPAAKPKAKTPIKAKAKAPAKGKAAPAKAKAQPKARAPAANHTGHDAPATTVKPGAAHDMTTMPAMDMPAGQAGAHDMTTMPGMDMPAGQAGAHDMATMPGMAMEPGSAMPSAAGTTLAPGNAPAPAPPTDHYADRVYAPEAMASARGELKREHGGNNHSMVLFNLAEYQFRNGQDGYRWDGEGWYGGDINRFVVKSEGEGAVRGGIESADVQALFSHAIGPYFNLQAGVRQDFKPTPRRTYATVGIEGLAPGFFEVEGAAFLSNKGDILGRLEGYYDQRITQRLILQPRVELNLSAQDVPEIRLGSGLTNAELGLRLRYEIRREFAPYVGLSYDRKFGDTGRFARTDGDGRTAKSIVLGIRTWF